MDSEKRILFLSRIRLVSLPIFFLLLAWSVFAFLANPYVPRVRPPLARKDIGAAIAYKARPLLDDCLRVMQSREMFKPSVLYETKKSEVVNVLGDLSFLGVMRSGDSIQALIMNKKSMQSSFYTQGQILNDLEIKEIQEDKITFRHGEETLELIR